MSKGAGAKPLLLFFVPARPPVGSPRAEGPWASGLGCGGATPHPGSVQGGVTYPWGTRDAALAWPGSAVGGGGRDHGRSGPGPAPCGGTARKSRDCDQSRTGMFSLLKPDPTKCKRAREAPVLGGGSTTRNALRVPATKGGKPAGGGTPSPPARHSMLTAWSRLIPWRRPGTVKRQNCH